MAKIIFGGYMIRYPLGGNISNTLQFLIGLKKLGHDVYFVEKSIWENECFDPIKKLMSNDCSYGVNHLNALLGRFEMQEKWAYLDFSKRHYGLSERELEEVFRTADLLIDYGSHGTWNEEAFKIRASVLIDGEPGKTQINRQLNLDRGLKNSHYKYYFTVGQNVGRKNCSIPTANEEWHKIYHPVVLNQFSSGRITQNASFTTIMNWQSRGVLKFRENTYGQKDVEFLKYLDLPTRTEQSLEVAVAGLKIPEAQLLENKWHIAKAHEVTLSYDSFKNYVQQSKGEFTVCKNIFVATNSGWFSDRSAAYLASGKPVVIQDTGFSEHIPCGRGLFAINNVNEAVAAIEEINANYEKHCKWAREIADEYFDYRKVLPLLIEKTLNTK